MNESNSTLYEQPIKELVRVSLRIEYLCEKIQDHLNQSSKWDSLECLQSILSVVTILERPEFKTSLYKEIQKHANYLNTLMDIPAIDSSRLGAILDELSGILDMLEKSQGKLASSLRKSDFLKSIRLQLSNIGGACNINTPSLNFWLNQTSALKEQQLNLWFKELEPIQHTIKVLLRLIRQSAHSKIQLAKKGFFEMALNSKQPLQLLRIEIPSSINLYPEISSGKHRLCIRFLRPNFDGCNTYTEQDIEFKLTLCVL